MNNIANFLRKIFRIINNFIEGKLIEFESKERVSNFIENKVKISSQSMDDINMVLVYFVDIMLVIFAIYVIYKIIDLIARKRRKSVNSRKRKTKSNTKSSQFPQHHKRFQIIKDNHTAYKKKSRKNKKNRKKRISIVSCVKNLLNKVHCKKNKKQSHNQSIFYGYEDDYSYDDYNQNAKRASYTQKGKLWENTDKDATCVSCENINLETTDPRMHKEPNQNCNRYMTKCNEKLKEVPLRYDDGSTIIFSTKDCKLQQRENVSGQKSIQSKSYAPNDDSYSNSAHKVVVHKRKKLK